MTRTTGHQRSEMPGTARVFTCQSVEPKDPEKCVAHPRRNELDSLLELGAYHYPLDLKTPDVHNHGTNTIRALADMFTCKLSNFPLTVGLFTHQNDKEYLSHLASELRNISRLSGPLGLRFSFLLFLFPLVVSTFLGYVVGMLTTWQVGLSIGHIGMFLQIAFLVTVIIGSRVCHNNIATRISHSVAEFLRWLQLVLNVCFCYPTRQLDAKAPVKTIIVYHRLWPSSTPNVALFSMVDKMWTGLIRMHGEIPIRLQRASGISPQPNRRFKRVCCLPAFLVVLAFCVAFIVETGMIRLYAGQVATMLTNGGRIAIFVLSSSILFLGLFGSLPSLYRLAKSLTVNPVQPLRAALAEFLSDEANEEEYNQLKPKGKYKCLSKPAPKLTETVALGNSTSLKNLAITAEEERARRADILIKEEFAKLCKLSLTFDRFLSQQQTRFVICLDASETKQCDVLAKLIYQIHSLVLTESTAPVAFVLEGNFKVLLGDAVTSVIYPPYGGITTGVAPLNVPKTLSDNLHLVHTSIHLPVYLEPPLFPDVECEQPQVKDLTAIPGNASPNGLPRSPATHPGNKRNSGIMYTPRSIFGNRSSVAPLRPSQEKSSSQPTSMQQITLSRSNSTASRSVETCHGIAGLFIRDNELADWNGKMMKQLVAATSFTSRFLRLCNLEVQVDEMIFWITLVQYWPYHVAWLVVYLEGLIEGKSMSTGRPLSNQTCVNLIECFKEVKSRVAASIERLEPLVTDDRNLDRLDSYLQAKASKPITIGSLKKLISCVLTHNPFLRYCIRAQLLNPDHQPLFEDHRPGQTAYAPAGSTLIEEQANPFRVSAQSTGSIGLYPVSRNNSGKGRMTQLSANSLSGDSQAAHFFPCTADILTSADETPRASMKGRLKLAKFGQPLPLSQYTANDVCNLMANMAEIEADHRYIYQMNIRERNVTGLVLYRLDPERLKHELGMSFPDWQVFYRTVHLLREQESLNRTGLEDPQTVIEPESDSGSLISPLVITNKHPCVGTAHSLNSLTRNTKSSPISSITSSNNRMKNPILVRQTPWLQSPQVPTSLMNSDGAANPATDIVFPPVHNSENSENQASLSGMEEPESLWKPSVKPTGSKPVLKQRIAGDTLSRNAEKTNPMRLSNERVDHESKKEAIPTARPNADPHLISSKLTKWPTNQPQERKGECHMIDGSSKTHPRNRSARLGRHDSRRYSSRSTVDLRTAFGPLSYNPQATEICYREALRRKSGNRRRATHKGHLVPNPDARVLFNQLSIDQAELMNMNILGYDQQAHDELGFGAMPVQHRSPWKLEMEETCDDMKDLRRMKKRPCRRSSKGSQPNYDVFMNKNTHETEIQMPPNAYSRKTTNESAIAPDSESDSVILNTALVSSFPTQVSWTQCPASRKSHRGRKLYRFPALNAAQLASLYSYVNHAGKLPTMINPGYEFPYENNAVETEIKQSRRNHFPFSPTNYASQYAEAAESYKPSQKKRSRHTEHTETQHVIASPRLSQSFLKPGHSAEHVVHVDYLDEGTNSPDSEAEECTCDYWYGIDRNGNKVTISEPTLRGDSDDLYSDDNLQTYSLQPELPKRNTHGKPIEQYTEENGSS